jgi:transcriptional regulator with XRE-family HTH domain
MNALSLRGVLAANLRRLKRHQRLTVEQLGARAGLGKNTVQRAIHGDTGPSVDTVESLAKGLNVEPWRLLKPDGP